MRPALALLLASALGLGCASPRPAPDPAASVPGAPDAGVARDALPAQARAPAPGSVWEARREGRLVVQITNTPGPLVDTNAPPPPPGATIAPHPFLSGACSGEPLECVRAGELLRASRSTADFLERLRADGLTVVELPR